MFKILQWNINGYYNNYTQLELLLKEHLPSFISLQETHIAADKSAAVPHQYQSYFHNLPQNATNKQGIAVLIKKSIPHRQLSLTSNIAIIAIEISVPFKFTIITLYIPPTQNISCAELRYILRSVTTPIIIVGDFNAWSPLWGSALTNSRGTVIEDLILSENLILLNDNKPTHFSTHKTFTTVDLTICSSNIAPKLTTNTLPHLHGSDHFPILSVFSTPPIYKTKPKPNFLTDRANWEKFQLVASSLCNNLPGSNNINKEVATVTKIIRTSAHLSIPQSTNKIFSKTVPYWSAELAKLRNEKRFYWTEYKRIRSNYNLILYKKANALFRMKSKQSKREYLHKFTESINHKTNPKKAWSDIKRLSGIYPQSTPIAINNPNRPIANAKELSNYFASYWSEYSHDSNFHSTFISDKHKYLKNSNNSSYTISNITGCEIVYNEIESTLSSLSGKTPGADRISYPMLQHLPLCLKIRLLKLYNNILNQGIYPQVWRNAVIIPILKPGNTATEVSGFRPIALLSCLGKLFEKIIAKRISWYALNNNCISPQQVAFKEGQGTIDALLLFENYASTALSNRNHLSVLSIDFEKAFDRVGGHIVLRQLEKWNLSGKILKIIQAFLTNRRFVSKVNNTFSDFFILHNGIPQGSPLSVVLFITAFNEISQIINKYKNVSYICYADDLLLCSQTNDLNIVKQDFINILSDLNTWSESSGANVSINKCKNFHICRKHKCNYFSLSYNNMQIVNSVNLKFLGVIFDKKLTFKEHCTYLRKQLAARLNIIKYLSSKHCLINSSTLINVTRALILSKIDYGLPIYGNCAKSNIKLIYSAYHTAVSRSIRAMPKSPTKFILTEAGLPTIEERFTTNTKKLIPKLFLCYNSALYEAVVGELQRSKAPRRKSTIALCIDYAREIGITSASLRQNVLFPPWLMKEPNFILNLAKYGKNHTNATVYQRLFAEVTTPLLPEWSLIFTDGSKTDTNTSFAVVNSKGETITAGLLPSYASVYTAEAAAILHGITFAENSLPKAVICTDSKSVIYSIMNTMNKTHIISCIRSKLLKNSNRIKLMWVPGHAGIRGNNLADERAKLAGKEPLITFDYISKKDVYKFIYHRHYNAQMVNWGSSSHHYIVNNPNRIKPNYPLNCRCNDIKSFVRLRLGHTIATHSYIFNGSSPPCCQHCHSPSLTVCHLLDDCPHFEQIRKSIFRNQRPSTLLRTTSSENISKMSEFLVKSGLKKLI